MKKIIAKKLITKIRKKLFNVSKNNLIGHKAYLNNLKNLYDKEKILPNKNDFFWLQRYSGKALLVKNIFSKNENHSDDNNSYQLLRKINLLIQISIKY